MKLSVSTWSFLDDMKKGMKLLDFPQMVRQRYDVGAVELCEIHFASTEPEYIRQVKANLEKANVVCCCLPVDSGNLSSSDSREREATLAILDRWLDVAVAIGAATLGVNVGTRTSEDFDISITIDSYRKLAKRAKAKGMVIVIENDRDIVQTADRLIRVVESSNEARVIYTCPDTGHFPEEIRHSDFARIIPYAYNLVQIKTYDFNLKGQQDYDLPRCLQILRESAFDGYLSIEYVGKKMDSFKGVQLTKDLIQSHLPGIH